MLKHKKKITRKSQFSLGKNGSVTSKSEDIREVITDGTEIEATLGTTISKDYNSVRVDCSVRLPTTKSRVRESFEEAWDLCGEELYAQLKQGRILLGKLK